MDFMKNYDTKYKGAMGEISEAIDSAGPVL